MATRWGICSAGMISSDFCSALRSLPRSEHEIVAVAARQKESAEQLAKKFNIPTAYGSYQSLAQDPKVEIVYVGTIHPKHYEACILMLEHGKHVLCEKPLTMTLKDTKALVAKAKEKKVFFMEGYWTRFFPAVTRMQEVLQQGTLGRVNILRANFCVPGAELPRLLDREQGGGGILDPGCYTVQMANLVFRQQPERVIAVGELNDQGVDTTGTIVLKYREGGMAMLGYSTQNAFGGNSLTIYGSKGNLQLSEPFHAPTELTLWAGEGICSPGTKEHFPLPESPYNYNFCNSVGFVYEAQYVRDCLKKGLTECPKMTHQDSVDIMTIMEEALNQLGVKY